MPWSQHVYSSNAAEIGFEEPDKLIVRWKNGRVSVYEGVPEEKARELANAPSVGRMLNDEIKPQYAHRYR